MWGAHIEQTGDNKSTRKEKKMQKAVWARKEEKNTIFYLETTPGFCKTKTRNTVTSEEQKCCCNNIPAAKADDCSLQGEWELNPQQDAWSQDEKAARRTGFLRIPEKRRSCHQRGSHVYQPLFWLPLEYLSLTISSTSFVAKSLRAYFRKTGFDKFQI
jgi:hypothetical protein